MSLCLRRLPGLATALLALALVGACARPGEGGGGAAAEATLASPQGAFLAYEHSVQLRLPGPRIPSRLKALADACQGGRFGDCAVLQLSQSGGGAASGSIELRIAPQGVEPIIALASEQGETVHRDTRAEDLAQQVADTRLAETRLRSEHARLLAYQQRTDLAVADLLTISQRLAEIEAGLEQAGREAAQQHRRIDTQKVTIRLDATSAQRNRSEIGRALGEFGGIFTTSLAYLIRFAAGVLPVLIVAALLAWGVRAGWRRRKARRGG
ncbi:DUF4349 domain-containing protein [Stenotrophomonas mori]|uniref:DUF4349 domain-containing protein n=1 Tax=Stenotrophomonas mori TaxID=2871096 RepID=A0ABT0SG81_9GAMM|nr:DUF4349 domain-containing protein [Stenotrophomonas mori]MCL7714317.1 DUF4349 domain-containing protein [Stenotrophomonas mori]